MSHRAQFLVPCCSLCIFMISRQTLRLKYHAWSDDCICYREITYEDDTFTLSEILIACDIGRKMGCEILTCQMQYEPRHKKTCFLPYANNNGADQPAHPRSLISAFVVRCLNSIIPLVSISAISNLCLASVAAQAGLSLPWSQTPKTGFLVTRLIWCSGQEHEQK